MLEGSPSQKITMDKKYKETIDFLFSRLPQFTKEGLCAYKPGLESTLSFAAHNSNPHTRLRVIHVGGTNGKGSTSAMLYSVLREAGFSVGLYTSPHLRDFRERMVVDGQMISQKEVIDFTQTNRDYILSHSLSFFEVTTIMAFDFFARAEVDFAIVEVGLGGRLDSTNIVNPILSIITNIALDHTDLLGSSIGEIALEKAGIIKNNCPVVIGERDAESAPIFEHTAGERESSLIFADSLYSATSVEGGFRVCTLRDNSHSDVTLGLLGDYQRFNLVTTLASIDILREQGFKFSHSQLLAGLAKATIRGRWETLHKGDQASAMILCDTAHNVAGVSLVVEQLLKMNYSKLYFVLAMVGDKDISGVLALLPPDAHYIFTQSSIPRAMDAEILAQMAAERGLSGEVCTRAEGGVPMALERAKQLASPHDLIFIGGSTFTVAECIPAP